MKQFKLLLLVLLTMAIAASAGEVKILQTEPVDITFDDNGNLYVHVNVEMQLANIKKEECALIMLMDNARWYEELTYGEFSNLWNTRCRSIEEVPVVGSSGKRTVKLVVPLEKKKFTGRNDTVFVRAYVFKVEPFEYMTQGDMMYFVPNYDVIRKAMADRTVNSAIDGFLGDLIGSFFGTKQEIPENAVPCELCGGSGKCWVCKGFRTTSLGACENCNDGRCGGCGGRGYFLASSSKRKR